MVTQLSYTAEKKASGDICLDWKDERSIHNGRLRQLRGGLLPSILTVVHQEAKLLDHGQVPGDPVDAVTVQSCNTQHTQLVPADAPLGSS